MSLIYKKNVPENQMPGRTLQWYVTKSGDKNAQSSTMSSFCMARVMPHQSVTPAHAHPDGEELIYIVAGKGEACEDGVVSAFDTGDVILFRQGCIHQIRNTGDEVLEMACFYGPATDISDYVFYPTFDFDSGEMCT